MPNSPSPNHGSGGDRRDTTGRAGREDGKSPDKRELAGGRSRAHSVRRHPPGGDPPRRRRRRRLARLGVDRCGHPCGSPRRPRPALPDSPGGRGRAVLLGPATLPADRRAGGLTPRPATGLGFAPAGEVLRRGGGQAAGVAGPALRPAPGHRGTDGPRRGRTGRGDQGGLCPARPRGHGRHPEQPRRAPDHRDPRRLPDLRGDRLDQVPLEAAGHAAFGAAPGSITTLHEDDYFHNRRLAALGDTRHLDPA